jgi:CBS domain-containing protein
MTTPVVAVPARMRLNELGDFFASEGVSGAPVKSESGDIVGIVSLSDLVQAGRLRPYKRLRDLLTSGPSVMDIMNNRVFCVPPDTPVKKVADLMIEEQIHRVLVGSIGHVVGIISSHDLLELIR